MYREAAGPNCKETTRRHYVYVCVCVCVCSRCKPKVFEACGATRTEPSGHGAAVQRNPVCSVLYTCMLVLILAC